MINLLPIKRSKPVADIPIAEDATTSFVPWIISLLVFLLCLVLAGSFSINSSLHKWHSGTPGKVTIEIPLGVEKDRQKTLSTVVTMVKKIPGVISIVPVDTNRLFKILEPWVGHSDIFKDLPLPLLFDVDVSPDAKINWQELAITLRHVSAGARLEFHSHWQETLSMLRSSLQIIAYVFSFLIALAVLITVMLVTRSGLDAHGEHIKTLQLLGAPSSYIAQEFQWQAIRLSSKGAVIGCLIALPIILILNWMSSTLGIPEILRPETDLSLLIVMVSVPLMIVFLSFLVSRLSVAHTLSRQI